MKSILEHIIRAKDEAILHNIEANTIFINKEIAKANGIYVDSYRYCPYAMILGMNIIYTDDKLLPYNANFVIAHTEIKSEYEHLQEEIRKLREEIKELKNEIEIRKRIENDK